MLAHLTHAYESINPLTITSTPEVIWPYIAISFWQSRFKSFVREMSVNASEASFKSINNSDKKNPEKN